MPDVELSLKLERVRMKTKLMNENKESLNNYLPSFILLFFPKGTTPISIINNSRFPRGETTLLFLLNILPLLDMHDVAYRLNF